MGALVCLTCVTNSFSVSLSLSNFSTQPLKTRYSPPLAGTEHVKDVGMCDVPCDMHVTPRSPKDCHNKKNRSVEQLR